MCVPLGSEDSSFTASARAARATSSALAVEVLTMPRPTLGLPLLRKYARRSAEASSIFATSPSRTT